MMTILKRMRILGIALAVAGVTVAAAGLFYGLPLADDGLDSAQAMYAAQDVTLSYDEEGRLLDRGTPEGAAKIMALLEEDWAYPVDHDNFNPDDPVVNTRDELMYQYAVITYHVLHGERTVTLTEADVPISYRGVTYTEPGEYQIAVEKYYAQLDRSNPIERQLREAWSPLALGLVAGLAAGHANQAAGELASVTSVGMAAIGFLFVLAGAGLIWISYGRPQQQARMQRAPRPQRIAEAEHAPPEREAQPVVRVQPPRP